MIVVYFELEFIVAFFRRSVCCAEYEYGNELQVTVDGIENDTVLNRYATFV